MIVSMENIFSHFVSSLNLRKKYGRAHLFFLAKWYSNRKPFFWLLAGLLVSGGVLLLVNFWSSLDNYLDGVEKSVVPGLAIGIGAAITGVIAIAFSLSLFAIQQVAERGTPATLRAYARDGILNLIYWSLSFFATICFGIALLRVAKHFQTAAAVTELILLVGSFVLLSIQFRRVIKFADPHFIVGRTHELGTKQLKILRMVRDRIGSK
jgi:hypothetical protein